MLLAESLKLLHRHIYIEEVILFPALARADLALTMLISMMEIGHAYMWPMISGLVTGTGPGIPFEDIRKTCTALDELLQLHNTREERVLYRAADRMTASSAGDHPLVRAIREAEMPAGWTCELALG
ncbi:hypothetical protein CDEF62S_05702 [Castellaniella defragrans]